MTRTRTVISDDHTFCNKDLTESSDCNNDTCDTLVCDSNDIVEKTKKFYINEFQNDYEWHSSGLKFNKVNENTCDISYEYIYTPDNRYRGYDRRRFHYERNEQGVYVPIKMDGNKSGTTVDYTLVIDPNKEYHLIYWNNAKNKYQWLVGWPISDNLPVYSYAYGDPISIEDTINIYDERQASVKFQIKSGKYIIVSTIRPDKPWSIRGPTKQLETFDHVDSSEWEMTTCQNEMGQIGFEMPWKIGNVTNRYYNHYVPVPGSTYEGIIWGGTQGSTMCIIPVPIT